MTSSHLSSLNVVPPPTEPLTLDTLRHWSGISCYQGMSYDFLWIQSFGNSLVPVGLYTIGPYPLSLASMSRTSSSRWFTSETSSCSSSCSLCCCAWVFCQSVYLNNNSILIHYTVCYKVWLLNNPFLVCSRSEVKWSEVFELHHYYSINLIATSCMLVIITTESWW